MEIITQLTGKDVILAGDVHGCKPTFDRFDILDLEVIKTARVLKIINKTKATMAQLESNLSASGANFRSIRLRSDYKKLSESNLS